eukprot:scaffold75_cov239-Chaetoceros_neogracile.AAC.3
MMLLIFTALSIFLLKQALAQECAETNNRPTIKLRVGLEWFINPDHLPLVVAKSHGIFEEFGLDVELVEPSNHWEAEEEIISGNLDVAVTEPLHLAQDAAKNKPVMGFSRFLHTDGGVLYDAADGSIKRPADMCGKTISYPGSPGPGGPAIVDTMVKADGGDCDLDSYGKYNGNFFHTDAIQSELARQYYYDYVNATSADETQQAIINATFQATLPAFPNDNNMSQEYYERLMQWLMSTNQVDAEEASQVPVSNYWTNEVSW